MLNTEQKVVLTVVFGLVLVLVAIFCMYPIQSIIATIALCKYSR